MTLNDPVEIHYAGVTLASGSSKAGASADAVFLSCTAPMPVGTALDLKDAQGKSIKARVIRVVESADAAQAGMELLLLGAAAAADTDGVPQAVGGDGDAVPGAEGSSAFEISSAIDLGAAGDDAAKKKKKKKR